MSASDIASLPLSYFIEMFPNTFFSPREFAMSCAVVIQRALQNDSCLDSDTQPVFFLTPRGDGFLQIPRSSYSQVGAKLF